MATTRRTTSVHYEERRNTSVSRSRSHSRDSQDSREDSHEYQRSQRPSAPLRANTNTSLVPARPAAQHSAVHFKRLVICCDGTWLDSNSNQGNSKPDPPSNVTRLARAIRSLSHDGTPQIVYYQSGVGSTGTVGNKVFGGATGDGLATNVRDAYSFISYNYVEGDEIFLIGFSRGAFTARSVAGFLGKMGVLTKEGVANLPIVYKDFANRHDRSYRSPLRDLPFPNKPRASDPAYARELERRGLTTLGVRVRAIACFDTVGSLGIPKLGWASNLSGQKMSEEVHGYKFYDTTLDDSIDNAFQALALDEKRTPFGPSLWEKRNNNTTNLIQVWFPGVHSNVGAGYNDQELGNISLAWMMAMLEPLLDMNLNYIHHEEKANAEYYERKGRKPRPWSFGKIYNSASGIYSVAGTTNRTPGDYYRIDPRTGEQTRKPLRDTNEYIHASVRSRVVLEGPGYGGRGTYNPPALKGWRLRSEKNISLPTPWFWESTGQESIILPEAPMRSVEKGLLKSSPDVYDYIFEPPQQGNRRPKSYG